MSLRDRRREMYEKCVHIIMLQSHQCVIYLDVFLKVNFTGGTGYVSFDENGDRPGYSGKDETSKPLCQTSQLNYLPTASVYNFNPVSDLPAGVNDVSYDLIPS